MSQAPERYSNKELLHSENDKLTNDTNQEQTMQSASFSRTYIDSIAYRITKSVGLELEAKIKF
ncbi:ETX/MTX2 family pore-forming toxin [Mesoplasma melaleucae]|uniref:ETX/MTX2 family pore-forming toxin n=1 Tax=Mesoplasma melaleucae TaxID=81459 RepID=UPI002286DDE1|nr:ETX/MTX2 family pore-forming toxin [Mesoplasma melaleucae]